MSDVKLYEIDQDGCVTTWVAARTFAAALSGIDAVDESTQVSIKQHGEDSAAWMRPIRNDEPHEGPEVSMRHAFARALDEMARYHRAAIVVASTEW